MTRPALPDETARRRVTDDLGTTFLVEAGAGTGKTTVLVHRLLALVRNGRGRLERIAAITFTEKAAAELRVRLRGEIDAALTGSLTDDERLNLQTTRLQLERAQLSTVHAFCAALLRERPVEARVDPSFTVLDQLAVRLLRTEVWQEWLAQEMDHGPDILKQALRSGLTLAHLETLRDFAVEQRDCLYLAPAVVASSQPEFRTLLVRCMAQLSTLRASCVNVADRALAQITALAALLPAGEDDRQWHRLLLHELSIDIRAGMRANWRPATALDEVRALLKQINEAHANAHSAWFHNMTLALVRWLGGYLRAYEDKKRERSSLDFTDLLLCTRDLLKQNLEVRRYFHGRFDYLLVDEFQDTDPLQAEIVFFLAEREPRATDWAGVELRPGKLFLVGDPQQSIYRFRRADLEVYAQVRAAIERQGAVLSLSANFRTRAPILTWINETFTREFAGMEVDQPPYRPLTATRQEETGREVVFLPVPPDLVSAQPSREELRQAEAKTVAAFLKQAVTYAGLAIWGDRAVQYRDIAVLFRTHQAMAAYEEALQSVGVPYRVYGGRRYANRQEVEELRALLRTIESPSDTVALVATLRSSLFGFTDEELALLVSTGGKLGYLTPSVPTTIPVADRWIAAFAVLRDLHARRAHISPVSLLYEIYDRTHLLPLFALRPQGAQRVANLLKLIDTARTLSTRGPNTLTALTRILEQHEYITEEGEPPITEDQDDALHLFTIHKAKGLEFPVVILADAVSTGGRSSRTGIIERITGSLELRIGPRTLTCTTQGWQKAEVREQARDAAEERRLWYVAAARARDHLIIPILPRVETKAGVRQWMLVDESPLPVDSVSTACEAGNGRAFVYHSSIDMIGQTAPASPVTAQFTKIEPDETVLRVYQEWDTRRRETLAKGRRTG